jgi:hypothetical protein
VYSYAGTILINRITGSVPSVTYGRAVMYDGLRQETLILVLGMGTATVRVSVPLARLNTV